MVRTFVFLSALLALTACTVTWDKPGATPEGFARDNYACEVDASRVAPVSDVQAINVGMKDRLYIACMESKGYRRQ
jgi:hypothetical protein